jgi:hypothetical protein
MKSICTIFSLAAFAVVLVGIALPGCDDPSVYEPAESQLPISKQRILNQVLIGNLAAGSNIYHLYDNTKGSFLFDGFINGGWAIGMIGRDCEPKWNLVMQDPPRYLCVVPPNTIGLADAFVIVGGIDTDSDGSFEKGFVQLIGANEQKLSNVPISKPDAEIWLNSVATIDALHFVAAGGARKNGIKHPYLITFAINADSTLAISKEMTFEEIENQTILTVVLDPSKTTSSEFVCYLQAEQSDQNGEAVSVAVHAVSGPKAGGADFVKEWSIALTQNDNLPWSCSRGSIMLHDETLYIAGSGEDKNKPLNESYWSAGFVGSVSTSGALNWLKMTSLSKHDDNYRSLFVAQNVLYAVGAYNAHATTSDNRVYGLALLSIFDPATGDEVYHLGFGDKEYHSSFSSIFVDGAKAYCAGRTNYQKNGESAQGWFAEIKIDSLSTSATAELPEIPEAGCNSSNASAVRPMRTEPGGDQR